MRIEIRHAWLFGLVIWLCLAAPTSLHQEGWGPSKSKALPESMPRPPEVGWNLRSRSRSKPMESEEKRKITHRDLETAAIMALEETSHNTLALKRDVQKKFNEERDEEKVLKNFVSIEEKYFSTDFITMCAELEDYELRGILVAMIEELRHSPQPVSRTKRMGLALVAVDDLNKRTSGRLTLVAGYQAKVQPINEKNMNMNSLDKVKRLTINSEFQQRLNQHLDIYKDEFDKVSDPNSRRLIDKEDYNRNASLIILVKYEGNDCVILGHETFYGTWSVFGGTAKYGEPPHRTARREGFEESDGIFWIDDQRLAPDAAENPYTHSIKYEFEPADPIWKKRKVASSHASYIVRTHPLDEVGLQQMVQAMRDNNKYADPSEREMNGLAVVTINEILEVAERCQGGKNLNSEANGANCEMTALAAFYFNHELESNDKEGAVKKVEGKLLLRKRLAWSLSHPEYGKKFTAMMRDAAENGTVFVERNLQLTRRAEEQLAPERVKRTRLDSESVSETP